MILPLRQRHRHMFAVIAIVLPITFGLGIAARKPAPSVAALPEPLLSVGSTFNSTIWEREGLFSNSPIRVRLLRASDSGEFALSLQADENYAKPDLLVYWVPGNPAVADVLPENSTLLGAFHTTALALPAEASGNDGVLILFSLADNEIVDKSEPFVAANVSSRQTSPLRVNSEDGRRLTSPATEE